MTVLGEAREYHELIAVLRKWMDGLGSTMEVVDEVAGLPTRYTSKIFAPIAIKTLGKVSLGATLGALGLKLLVAIDDEQLARIKHRLVARKNSRAHGRVDRISLSLRDNPDLARLLQRRWVTATTPRQRRRWGRQGAQVRWGSHA